MRSPFLLDEHEDAPVPTGYVAITNEVEFFRRVLDEDAIMVQGQTLCRWARELCEARGYLYEYRGSPSVELLHAFPEIGENGAQHLALQLQQHWETLPRPLRLDRIVDTLWPNGLWLSELNTYHAARWLLWLLDSAADRPDLGVLSAIATGWKAQTSGSEVEAYSATTPEHAWDLLQEWIGISPSVRYWPKFLDIDLSPKVRLQARTSLRQAAVATRGAFFSKLKEHTTHKGILREAAEVAAEYFRNNPDFLTEADLNQLRPYLSEDLHMVLRNIKPPEMPGDPRRIRRP